MEDERFRKIAAHLSALRERAKRPEDADIQALADICEWQQEQLDEDGGVLARCEDWTAQVQVLVDSKFAEINKLIVHDREAFEVIFKNYFELKQQLDFLQRSIEVIEATLGIDLAGEKERQESGAASHRCIRDGEVHPYPSLACSLCRGQEYSEEAHRRYREALDDRRGLTKARQVRCMTCDSMTSKLNNLVHEWMKEARIWAMASGIATEHREAGIRRCIRELCEKVLDRQPPEEWAVEPAPLSAADLDTTLGALDDWEQECIGTEARAMLESLVFEVRQRRIDGMLHQESQTQLDEERRRSERLATLLSQKMDEGSELEKPPLPLTVEQLATLRQALSDYAAEYEGEEALVALEALIREVQRHRIDAVLHPSGRCTCAGEGTCDWCTKPCPGCGEKYIECRCTEAGWRDGAPEQLGCYEVVWTSEPPEKTSFLVIYMDRAGDFFGVCKNWVAPGKYDEEFQAKIVRHRRMVERSSDGT